MIETPFELTWDTLRNPFQEQPGTGEKITSHVSGRRADIQEIVTGGQSAIILLGAPNIGKTTLVRYLQRPPTADWSWRNELGDLNILHSLNDIHFTKVDLSPLKKIDDIESLLSSFIVQCITALKSVWSQDAPIETTLKGLRELLRRMTCERTEANYYVVLDALEHLHRQDMYPTKAQTRQERGMALLDDCGAFRVLVDLLDEFNQLGVILSLQSLSLSRIDDQFRHVSVDLARFRTMTLQAFTREDALLILAQSPEDFGAEWAHQFRHVGGNEIFTKSEQAWLYEQIGTHPYLLQQFCFHAFHFKREYALRRGSWGNLPTTEREQLIDRVNERLGSFLESIWKRVKASLDTSSQETRNGFYDFIAKSRGKSASEEINPSIWNQLGLELRYILYSEGIVRYDPLRPVYYPGSMLLNYLAQKAREQNKADLSVILPPSQATIGSASELIITLSGKQPQPLELTSLENALMITLLHHPDQCSEEALMKSAWGKITGKQVLTQRLFHLRKKLRDACDGEEMIENIYGGFYSLKHPEWFSMR